MIHAQGGPIGAQRRPTRAQEGPTRAQGEPTRPQGPKEGPQGLRRPTRAWPTRAHGHIFNILKIIPASTQTKNSATRRNHKHLWEQGSQEKGDPVIGDLGTGEAGEPIGITEQDHWPGSLVTLRMGNPRDHWAGSLGGITGKWEGGKTMGSMGGINGNFEGGKSMGSLGGITGRDQL